MKTICRLPSSMVSKMTMVRALLDERFFNSCLVHEEDKKNEENSFCIDCCFSLCYNCLPHHQTHRILQIRRYMYKDVLRLKDAQKIFDCSLIQSFITNSEKVILLRPRQRDTCTNRGSRCTCLVCNHHIKKSFVYCSMACKFYNQKVYPYSSKDFGSNLLVSGSLTESLVSMENSVEENSSNSTAGDVTNNESMPLVRVVDQCETSTATSSKAAPENCMGESAFLNAHPFFNCFCFSRTASTVLA